MIIQYFRGAQNNSQLVNAADCYSKYQQLKVFDINLPEIEFENYEEKEKVYQKAFKEFEKDKNNYEIKVKEVQKIWEDYVKADKAAKNDPADQEKRKVADDFSKKNNEEQLLLIKIKEKYQKSEVELNKRKKELEDQKWVQVFNYKCNNNIKAVQSYFIVIDNVFNNHDIDILLHNNVISITSSKNLILPKGTRLLVTFVTGG